MEVGGRRRLESPAMFDLTPPVIISVTLTLVIRNELLMKGFEDGGTNPNGSSSTRRVSVNACKAALVALYSAVFFLVRLSSGEKTQEKLTPKSEWHHLCDGTNLDDGPFRFDDQRSKALTHIYH